MSDKKDEADAPPFPRLIYSSDPDIPAHVRNANPDKMAQAQAVRDRIGESFTGPIDSQAHNPRPMMVGIHLGTGSGKTHHASRLPLKALEYDAQLIFTTSNKALVEQARSAFEDGVAKKSIPVYVSYGLEDHWSDEVIEKEAAKFIDEIQGVEGKDKIVWGLLKNEHAKSQKYGNDLPAFLDIARTKTNHLKQMVRGLSTMAMMGEDIEKSVKIQRAALTSELNWLSKIATRVDVNMKFTKRIAPTVGKICRRIWPYDYALYFEPGPVIMTHQKYNAGPSMATITVTPEKRNNNLPTPPSHVAWTHFINEKLDKPCILIHDEEEDAHRNQFESLSANIDSPQTWFPTITSVAIFFLWDMFSLRQSPDVDGSKQLLFESLDSMVSNYKLLEEAIDQCRKKQCSLANAKQQLEQILGLRTGEKRDAVDAIWRLLDQACRPLRVPGAKEKAHDPYYGLEYYASCWQTVLQFKEFIKRHKLFAREPNMLVRWNHFFEFVSKKHRLVVTRPTLAEIGGNLQYLFFDDKLQLVHQDMLPHIYCRIMQDSGDIELIYKPDEVRPEDFTLSVMLRLLLWTALVISFDKKAKLPATPELVGLEDQDYVRQILTLRRVFTNKAFGLNLLELTLDNLENAEDRIIDDDLVFEQAKGFFSISTSRQNLRSDEYLSAFFSVSALVRSPESLLLAALFGPGGVDAPHKRNVVIDMSATSGIGGIFEHHRGYIDENLGTAGGERIGFTDQQEEITRDLRELSTRTVEVGYFQAGKLDDLTEISRRNAKVAFALIAEPINNPAYANNPHKQSEFKTFLQSLCYLAQRQGPHAGIHLTQNTTFIIEALEMAIENGIVGLKRGDARLKQVYEIDPELAGMQVDDNRPIRIILYESRFLKKFHYAQGTLSGGSLLSINEGFEDMDELDVRSHARGASDELMDEEDEPVSPEDLDRLQEALTPHSNLDDNKVLFVSRYISADRGISVHCLQTIDGALTKRDYDYIVLANHRYYDSFLRRRDRKRATMEQFMAGAKQWRKQNKFGLFPMTEMAKELMSRPHELLHEPQVQEQFCHVMQATGRLDRGRRHPVTQRFFICEDYVPDIVEGNELADGFEKRSVKTPFTVIAAAKDFCINRSPCIKSFDEYELREVKLATAFLHTVDRFVKDLRSGDRALRERVSAAWSGMRDLTAMTDPKRFLDKLGRLDWPYGPENRRSFIDYLFMDAQSHGGDRRYYKRHQTPHTVGSESIWIITDMHNHPAGRRYYPEDELLRLGLIESGRNDYARICRKLGLGNTDLFGRHLPRWHFFHNFIKGFAGEMLAREALKECKVTILGDDWAIYRNVFEDFDTYCRLRDGRLVAIDSKHWTRIASKINSAWLRTQAVSKAQKVSSMLKEKVLFLYMNTFGGTFLPPYREKNLDIEYMSLFHDDIEPGMISHRFQEIFRG